MMVVVRLQIMRIMGVIVRLESVFRVLVSVPIVVAMLVWLPARRALVRRAGRRCRRP